MSQFDPAVETMNMVVTSHFVIEYVEPATNEIKWARNKSLDVICENAERAIELLRSVSSNSRIDVVRRVGTNRTVLIDAKSIKETI